MICGVGVIVFESIDLPGTSKSGPQWLSQRILLTDRRHNAVIKNFYAALKFTSEGRSSSGSDYSNTNTALVQRAQAFQELLRVLHLRKQFFFFTESRWMNQAPAAAQLDRMPQVQHFMVDQIFNRITRHRGAV